MDDTFVIQQQAHQQLFLDHINSIDPAIKFTVEGNQENGAIPFLDTLVKPEADNSLSITVYQKPTHNDQYLQCDINHNLSAKYNVIGTLTHRAKTVCSTTDLPNEELQILREALVRCKYPRWTINKIQNKFTNNSPEGNSNNNTLVDNNTTQANNNSSDSSEDRPPRGRPNIGPIVFPYVQGLGESIKNVCARYGIQTHFKGNRTLRQVLVKPKDQDPKEKKNGVIYCYQCGAINCGEEYIGGTSRTLGKMLQKASQGVVPYTWAQPTHWSSAQPWPIQHNRKGGPGPIQVNQRIILHNGK